MFQSTKHATQPRHVTDNQSKPDIVGAFEKDWRPSGNEGRVPWPRIRLAAEAASKGKSKDDQEFEEKQAVTYLDLLLLARPDFKAAFGLLISEKEFTLLVGIGGDRIHKFTFRWKSRFTRQVAYALVHCLYDFPRFQDSSITMTHNKATQICTYTFTLDVQNEEGGKCRQVSVVPASSAATLKAPSAQEPTSSANLRARPRSQASRSESSRSNYVERTHASTK